MAKENLDKLRNILGISNTALRDCLKSGNFKKNLYMKYKYRTCIHTSKITPDKLCGIFNKQFMRTASTEKAANGFRITCIVA